VSYQTDGPGIATFQFKTNGVDISHSEIVRTVTGDISKHIPAAGTYTFTWDAKRDYPEQVLSDLTVEVTLWATNNPPIYCAVNLVGNPYAVRWYGKESEVPFGVTDSQWKKTWLLMRQIPSTEGEFVTLGSPDGETDRDANAEFQRNVRITKPFYMGIYQVTQRQWQQVMGNRPSYFSNSDVYEERPVERVSYNVVRGAMEDSPSVNWPTTGYDVSPTSFLGLLRSRTGNILEFDVPTSSQWEYACRAGTSGAWNNGTTIANGTSDTNLDKLGRYRYNGGYINNGADAPSQNCTDEYGTAKVGSYLPNAWGLYDMHGNVFEICRDFATSGSNPSLAGDDPPGIESIGLNDWRFRHGGSWLHHASVSRSARLSSMHPADADNIQGFRIVARAEVLIAP